MKGGDREVVNSVWIILLIEDKNLNLDTKSSVILKLNRRFLNYDTFILLFQNHVGGLAHLNTNLVLSYIYSLETSKH